MEQVHIVVSGRVQGVFFRAEASRIATELELTGYVKNTMDGGVELLAQGPMEKLEKLIEWCRHGPKKALVERMDYQFIQQSENFEGFEIRY